MRRLLVIVLLLIGIGPARAEAPHPTDAPNVELVLFYGEGCPHCAALHKFLDAIGPKYPALQIRAYEVYGNGDNARLFERVASAYGAPVEAVPTLFLGDNVIVGFSAASEPELEQKIRQCIEQHCASPLQRKTRVPEQALALSAVVLGAAVDAINPCEFAVLIILTTAVLAAAGRRQALFAGLAFSAAVYISYYLMGVGLYSAVQAAGIARGLHIAVALLAILIGLFNLKDFFWYGKGFLMEVPLSWRPTLKRLIKGVTSVPGAFLIGFVVSLFLLPCTSGPYIVILGLLASTATRASALLWLLLYNAIFIIPMLAITGAVYLGLTTTEGAEEWRSRYTRLFHLITGTIILSLGIAVLVLVKTGYL